MRLAMFLVLLLALTLFGCAGNQPPPPTVAPPETIDTFKLGMEEKTGGDIAHCLYFGDVPLEGTKVQAEVKHRNGNTTYVTQVYGGWAPKELKKIKLDGNAKEVILRIEAARAGKVVKGEVRWRDPDEK